MMVGMTVLQGGMFEEEVSEAGESVFVRPDTGLWLMVDGIDQVIRLS